MNILKWVNGGHQRSMNFYLPSVFVRKRKYITGKNEKCGGVLMESPKMIAMRDLPNRVADDSE